jgi:hypothetical protein
MPDDTTFTDPYAAEVSAFKASSVIKQANAPVDGVEETPEIKKFDLRPQTPPAGGDNVRNDIANIFNAINAANLSPLPTEQRPLRTA